MIKNHMNPYSAIEVLPDGVRYLPIQLEGAEPGELAEMLRGRQLLACKVPTTQTASLACQVILNFDSNVSLELTCSSTVVQGGMSLGLSMLNSCRVLLRNRPVNGQIWSYRKDFTLHTPRSFDGKVLG